MISNPISGWLTFKFIEKNRINPPAISNNLLKVPMVLFLSVSDRNSFIPKMINIGNTILNKIGLSIINEHTINATYIAPVNVRVKNFFTWYNLNVYVTKLEFFL